MRITKNLYFMWWYFMIIAPKMKANAGAVWPIVRIRSLELSKTKTLKHEKTHLWSQLMHLLIPWLILYGIFLIFYGYYSNPFEQHARAVAAGLKWNPYGWIRFMKKIKR